jgi:hypothetical protein
MDQVLIGASKTSVSLKSLRIRRDLFRPAPRDWTGRVSNVQVGSPKFGDSSERL